MDDTAKSPETQIEELQHAITALEAQRAVLGEAVIGEALAAMQAKLTALRGASLEQRKLVTVLFADLVGFTALSEKLDPEDVRELQQDYFLRWRRAIEGQGGVVEKFIGDAVMALFGVPAAREDDPERAVRAALGLHASLAELNAARGTHLQMRAGVHTGPVLVSGGAGNYVATGDAVNVAARLQANAPPGGSLISHDTFQQVLGVFETVRQPPLLLKGKAEPMLTYRVERPLPAGFRAIARGVEGVETRLVGREVELLSLQRAYADVVVDRTARMVLVVGEPGLGKSRLAYEFGLWLLDKEQLSLALRARSTPQSSATPAALLRDLLSQDFAINDTDSAEEVLAKFRAGTAGSLEQDEADLLGQFCGFDFSASEAVRRLLGQDALANLGLGYLAQYLERLGESRPLVILLEDLHWADDFSLDALQALLAHGRLAIPLLLIGLTRPAFFERRPHWAEGLEAVTRLPLNPLSRRESRDLVAEILRQVQQLPGSLRDLIVNASEGNPFFAEEVVKMLIDDGVILVEPGGWQVAAERVAGVRVPGTLTGVLQARLDSLPPAEREALQRAAVVGREFWDEAVARLGEAPAREPLAALLNTLRSRELVYRHEHSAFADTTEFAFKHALLRDVTYETVLRRLRRTYHREVAEWMEQRAAGRLAEHADLIAYHFQQAEAGPQALRYLTLAAETALGRYANAEAAAYFKQALGHASSDTSRASLLDGLGRALARRGDFAAAIEAWREAIEGYRALDDSNRAARLYARVSRSTWDARDTSGGLAAAREGLQAMAGAPVSPGLAALYHEAGRAAFFNGLADEAYTLCQQALDMAEELGAVDVQADTLATLGLCPQLSWEARAAALRRAVELAEGAGLLLIAQRAQNNLGQHLGLQGNEQAASLAAFSRASQIARQRGSVSEEAFLLGNVISASAVAGDLAGAREGADRMRWLAQTQPESQLLKYRAQMCEASCRRYQGDLEQAIAIWQECSHFFDTTDDPQAISWLYADLGAVLCEVNELGPAEAALVRAIQSTRQAHGIGAGVFARVRLAEVRARQGRLAEVEPLVAEADALAGPGQDNGSANIVQRGQAWLAVARADWETALSTWHAIRANHIGAGRRWLAAACLLNLADTYQMRGGPGDREQARALIDEALAALRAMGATGYVSRLEERLRALDANPG